VIVNGYVLPTCYDSGSIVRTEVVASYHERAGDKDIVTV
jgi:hypothetical protein